MERLLLAGLILTGYGSAQSVYNFGSRVEGALFHFEFLQDQCEAGSFEDSVGLSLFGNLNRNTDTTACNDGIGVTLEDYYELGSAQVLSDYNATRFIDAMYGLSNYTLEVWKKSGANFNTAFTSPLLTIGAIDDTEENSCTFTNTHSTYNMQMFETQAVTDGRMTFRFLSESVSNDVYCPSQQTASSAATNFHKHFVVTVAPGDPNAISVYVDGELDTRSNQVGSGQGDTQVSSLWQFWDKQHFLQLFGDTQNRTEVSGQEASVPWNGAIYSVAFYNFSLTAEQVLQNYQARLPDSIPSVSDSSDSEVNEDGMSAAKQKDPDAYYAGVSNTELQWVTLDAVDQDEDSSYPNYNESDVARRPMKLYLSELPTRSTVYSFFGEELTSVSSEVPPVYEDASGNLYNTSSALALGSTALNKTYRVRVRPMKNMFSAQDSSGNYLLFDNFTFYAVDGVTGEQSGYATLAYSVIPMNDPPQPRNFRQYISAGVPTVVYLNSSDVDNGLDFKTAYITKYPKYGTLFQNTPYGETTNCTVPTPDGGQSILNYCGGSCDWSNCSTVQSVSYLLTNWSGLVTPDAADGIVGSDSFEYIVTDNQGYNSTVATVKIILTTPITVNSVLSSPTVYEDVPQNLTLTARDYSFENRRLQVEVVTVPSYGTLREAVSGRVLSAGDILDFNFSYPSAYQLDVEYASQSDYFNSPATNWDGTSIAGANSLGDDVFSVKAVTLDGSGLTSLPTSVPIEVVNVNDVSILTSPIGDLSVYAFASLNDDEGEYPTTLTLSGINMTSPDGDVDFVKVRLTCEYGRISINPTNLSRLDFTSSEYCFDTSQSITCKNAYGDGFRDIIYLGAPSDIARSLTDMTYRSSTDNVVDTCVILLYDGAGGDCMPQDLLDDRRDGSHTDDDSDDMSIYLSLDDLTAGISGSVQCYEVKQNFTVSVLEFANSVSDSSCTIICVNWKIVLVVVLAIVACCLATPIYLQRKYTTYINSLIGLALYDSDDEEDPKSVTARLYMDNDAENWVRIACRKGNDVSDEDGDEDFYYYNIKTGRSQWERPLFTLSAPISHDLICLQEAEDDPRSWVALTMVLGESEVESETHRREDSARNSINPLLDSGLAVVKGPQQYYYNTVTKRTTWTPPRFSSNWVVSDAGEAERLAPVLDRSSSGFQSVFGVQKGRYLDSKPLPPAPWDFSQVRDPSLVHGRFKVDSNDERREAFEAAARYLREKAEWDGGSDAVCEVPLSALVKRAEFELEQLRRNHRSTKGRRTLAYSDVEVSHIVNNFQKKGVIEMSTSNQKQPNRKSLEVRGTDPSGML